MPLVVLGPACLAGDTCHWAGPCLPQAGLLATIGAMPAGRREGLGRAGVGAGGGLQLHSGISDIGPSQGAGSDKDEREAGRAQVTGATGGPGEGAPLAWAPWGLPALAWLLGKPVG